MSQKDRYERDEKAMRRRDRRKERGRDRKKAAVGLRLPFTGWKPRKRDSTRRYRQAKEAGYSEREAMLVAYAPFRFVPWKWRAVRKKRRETTVDYCKEFDISIPSKEDWKDYWAGGSTGIARIRRWEKASGRIDAQFGHLTIFDVFYEGGE